MMRLAALLLGLAMLPLAHATMMPTPLRLLWQPAPFVLALFLPLAIGAVFYRSDLFGAFRTAGSLLPSGGDAPTRRSVEVLRSLRRLVLACTAIGLVLSLIHIAGFLDRPEVLPQGIIIIWIGVFYGVFASELLLAPMIRQVVVRSFGAPDSPLGGGGATASETVQAQFLLLILSVGIVAAVWVSEGEGVWSFVQPSALVGLFPALFLPLAWHSPAGVRQALWGASIEEASDEALQAHSEIFSSCRSLLYGSAALCHVLGSVHSLVHLSPDLGRTGTSLAISLTPWIYAAIVGELVFGPRRHRIEAELTQRGIGKTALQEASSTGPGALVLYLLSLGYGLTVVLWVLLQLP